MKFRSFEKIDPETFDYALKEYPSVVPPKLTKLDIERYETIPASLGKRAGDVHLTKDEVATLVDWKLSHGKFRPTLKALVQRNEPSSVESLTKDAFKAFSTGSKSPDEAKQAVNTLSKLQGIGPATASLLLSASDPETVPFFSDELFRWCFFENSGKGNGWDRDIKYNVKEYVELYDRVQKFRESFKVEYGREVSAVEMEKVAYVLGKRATDYDDYADAKANTKKRKADDEFDESAKEEALADVRKNDESQLKSGRQSEQTSSKPTKAKKRSIPPENATAASNRPKRTRK